MLVRRATREEKVAGRGLLWLRLHLFYGPLSAVLAQCYLTADAISIPVGALSFATFPAAGGVMLLLELALVLIGAALLANVALWTRPRPSPSTSHLPLPTGAHKLGVRDCDLPSVGVRVIYPTSSSASEGTEHSAATQPDSPYLSVPADTGVKAMLLVSGWGGKYAPVWENLRCARLPASTNAPLAPPPHDRWPVIVFSRGDAGARETYSAVLMDIASHGWVVIALEHRDGSALWEYDAGHGPSASEVRALFRGASGYLRTARTFLTRKGRQFDQRVGEIRHVLEELFREAATEEGERAGGATEGGGHVAGHKAAVRPLRAASNCSKPSNSAQSSATTGMTATRSQRAASDHGSAATTLPKPPSPASPSEPAASSARSTLAGATTTNGGPSAAAIATAAAATAPVATAAVSGTGGGGGVGGGGGRGGEGGGENDEGGEGGGVQGGGGGGGGGEGRGDGGGSNGAIAAASFAAAGSTGAGGAELGPLGSGPGSLGSGPGPLGSRPGPLDSGPGPLGSGLGPLGSGPGPLGSGPGPLGSEPQPHPLAWLRGEVDLGRVVVAGHSFGAAAALGALQTQVDGRRTESRVAAVVVRKYVFICVSGSFYLRLLFFLEPLTSIPTYNRRP